MGITTTINISGEEDDEEVVVPGVWCICDGCQGSGGSSAYLGAFTMDEVSEKGEEWAEDYFAGNFDRLCEDCDGAGKVLLPDETRMEPDVLERLQADRQARREDELERKAEMRAMGMY